ncbi:hypothetical protein SAMN04488029_3153 [Reichenbachiella faecimaris]|uniref:C-terminal domain of CHU protein family protein n=1 Tax=Reichenbachiella faecimaris TaxID=692418 RepID=A0A1W2GJW3_REIFA|nr:hypothetical protein [Reichenbachiella faecimaris]SMD36940.1 hypothetical protein SAMN04488029_3153 [Reichenbachiella faecimaris]
MKGSVALSLLASVLLFSFSAIAQSVGVGTETPNANAILELVAPNNNQGLLVPRMTTVQRTASTFTSNLSTVENGLMVYDEDLNKFFFWINDQWTELATGNLNGLPDQVGHGGKYLTTDGSSSLWNDIDFSDLINVPSDLLDGDDDTQLTDADIAALGYIKSADDADIDPTNENQTVSAGTGISVTQTDEDFEVTNTSPDQTVVLSDGGSGNVTIGGTYPNLTIDVPDNLDNSDTNEIQDISTDGTAGDITLSDGSTLTLNVDDADADPSNEDQTVSAGTGISVNQVGDDFEVTNTSPDQTVALSDGGSGNVTIGGTYPNLTIDVPDNLDNSPINEIELPDQTSQGGNFLTTDGSDPAWTAIAETQWNTNGTSINYATGNVNIGSGTIPTSPLQLSTSNASSTTPQLTISESNTTSDASFTMNNAGNAFTLGVDGTDDYFKISDATSLGSNDRVIIDNLGSVGVGVTPNAQFHVESGSSESTTVRVTNNHDGAGSKIGTLIELDDQGSAIKTGVYNNIDGTASSTQQVRGIYNLINPTDGTTYGMHTQINATGTGIRMGAFSDVRAAGTSSSLIYGFRANMDHDGTGDSYGLYAQMSGSTTGTRYGVFTDGEDQNYFSGHVGIGDQDSDVELTIKSFDLNSTLPLVRLNSGANTSDAGISFSVTGGNEYIVGVDATDDYFKISDGAAAGSGERFTIDNSGNVGVNQSAPSAKLDVVGTSEFNGTVDIQSSLDVTGQLTVTNDIEIPETNAYTYASAQTRQASYHPTEFQVMRLDGDTEDLVSPLFTTPYVYFSGGGGSGLAYATAPIKLPDGAIVTELEAWLFDNNATASRFARVNLYRSDIGVIATNSNMAQVETTAESASVQELNDNTIFFGTIDNDNYTYRILYTSNDDASDLQLHGVRITYTVLQVD